MNLVLEEALARPRCRTGRRIELLKHHRLEVCAVPLAGRGRASLKRTALSLAVFVIAVLVGAALGESVVGDGRRVEEC